MGQNWYAQAITLLENLDPCCPSKIRKMLFELGRRHPKTLVDVHSKFIDADWKDRCLALLKEGQKIQAIKLCREATRLGLKEAKEAVEALT